MQCGDNSQQGMKRGAINGGGHYGYVPKIVERRKQATRRKNVIFPKKIYTLFSHKVLQIVSHQSMYFQNYNEIFY